MPTGDGDFPRQFTGGRIVIIKRQRVSLRNEILNRSGSALPTCPDCGSDVEMQVLGTPRAYIEGMHVLFYCVNEFNCGWAKVSGESVQDCALFYTKCGREHEPLDISKIKKG